MDNDKESGLRPAHVWQGIRGRTFFFFALVLALCLAGAGKLVLNIFRAEILESRQAENIGKAEAAKDILESYLDSLITTLNVATLNSAFMEWSISVKRRNLERLLDKIREVVFIQVLDIKGNVLLELSGNNSRKGGLSDRISDTIKTQNVLDSVLKGNYYIGNIFRTNNAIRMLTIYIPLESNDAVNGILSVVVSLNDGIFKRIDVIDLTDALEIFIIDTNGWPIAHITRNITNNIPGTRNISDLWEDLRDILGIQYYMSGPSESKLKKPLVYKNINQQDVLGVLVTCPKLKWGVIVEEELDTIIKPLKSVLDKYILITILVFIILCFFAAIIIAHITSPVIKLYQYTGTLNDALEKMASESKGETARIAENINRLVRQLAQKDRELRQRYKEIEFMGKGLEHPYQGLEKITGGIGYKNKALSGGKSFINRVINSIDLLIVGLDTNGQVVSFNKFCEKKLSYTFKDIKGKDWFDIAYPIETKTSSRLYFKKLLETKVNDIMEDSILTRDKSLINVRWHISIVDDAEGTVELVFFFGEDTKEKRDREEELEAQNLQLMYSNEELENILSIVSHDLKNPLYIIQDFASILDQEYKDTLSEDALYYLQRIKANAKHMEKLIKDLLDLSRTARIKGVWQECSVSEIIKRAIGELKEPINTRGIKIKMPEKFPILKCDSERILQVFMNLMSNSIKFIGDTADPCIEIGWSDKGEEYEFYMKDNGIGIEPEYHEKIFVIFQRLQDVKDVEGTGVGLTIVKKVIENHGGRVWVESKKGEGATFYFTIPKGLPINV